MKHQKYVESYFKERRAFGFSLVCEERYMNKFAIYVDQKNSQYLKVSDFLDWKKNYGNANESTWNRRLGIYRKFAIWLTAFEKETEVPPSDLIGAPGFGRKTPYIYSENDVGKILNETQNLRSKLGLRRHAFHTLFGLYSATGLRTNEALNLRIEDVNLDENILHIIDSKTNQQRIVPIDRSTSAKLESYHIETLRLTDKRSRQFFVVEDDRGITEFSARYAFAQISQIIGLRKTTKFNRHGIGPRIHDFRHTFAVNTLISALEKGLNIDNEIFKLSTFLGHSSVEGTYWYIEAVPELLLLMSQKTRRLALCSQ